MERQYTDDIAKRLEMLKEVQEECNNDYQNLYEINKHLFESRVKIENNCHGEVKEYLCFVVLCQDLVQNKMRGSAS